MTQNTDLFAALAAPFEPDEVRVRPQGSRQLHYVTARTVMNRLDDVLGPANWWDEYVPLEHSVICKLTIRLPDGNVLTKSDAGGYAGMPDSGDDDKSGFSDSFKRAAVKFGVGRYLYRDGVPKFARDRFPHGRDQVATVSNSPSGPTHVVATNDHAVPVDVGNETHPQTPQSSAAPTSPAPTVRPAGESPGKPRSGKALFAWIKQQDEKHGANLLQNVSEWGKDQGFPARMVQWSEEQVNEAYTEALGLLHNPQAEVVGAGHATGGRSPERRNGRGNS